MSGPDTETLTAALRRLADEHASGLLSVATPGRDVVVELEDGVPVAIGPVHDVSDRVGPDADEGLVAVAVVDDLVDRTVAAIIGGEGDWVWDVASDADRTPVPPGLVTELARRAVDAAQALSVLDPDDVLAPGHDVTTSGELGRVRDLFDGERSIEEVAEEAGRTMPAVATMTAALLAAGALGNLDAKDEPVSWSDAVRASDDDEDDEPELWVMEPAEDEPEEDEPDVPDEPAPAAASTDDAPRPRTPDLTTVSAPPVDEPSATPAEAPTARDTADDWNDTTWLDELAPQDEPDDAPPVLAAGDDEPVDARAALSSMLQDLQGDEPPPPARPEPADEAEPDDGDAAPPGRAAGTERREPKAEPGEVAEFLRELSRLALDDE